MDEYIVKSAAVVIADYAADEHPYDKNPENPDTFSDYNRGWNDACDYIRAQLENVEKADVVPVQHGNWTWDIGDVYICSHCGEKSHVKEVMETPDWSWCPNCGAWMGGADNGE